MDIQVKVLEVIMVLNLLFFAIYSTNVVTYTANSYDCSNHVRWYIPTDDFTVYESPDLNSKKVDYTEKQESFASDYILYVNGNSWVHHANGIGFIPDKYVQDITYYEGNDYCNIIHKEIKPYYTGESLWINSNNSFDKIKIANNIKKRGTSYSYEEIYDIVSFYEYYGKSTQIDWILALGQNMHETDWLRSWWSQPPRRNFAGIGVYGVTAYNKKGKNWSCLENNICYHGYSYDSSEESVKAHIGLILNYVVEYRYATKEQKNLMSLYDNNMGYFTTPNSMNGTWAVPGMGYGEKIAIRANQLMEE